MPDTHDHHVRETDDRDATGTDLAPEREWNPRPFIQWLLDGMNQQMWKQVDLARVLGVSPPTVSRWLAPDVARQPHRSHALKLAQVFDADPEHVLMLAGHYAPSPEVADLDHLLRLLGSVDLTVDHRARTLLDMLESWRAHDRRARDRRRRLEGSA